VAALLLRGLLFVDAFLCVSIGLNYITASNMSVFVYTAPLFTMLSLDRLVPGELFGAAQWPGCAVCFDVDTSFSRTLTGDALDVLDAVFWAATTIMIKRSVLSSTASSMTLLC